jgi:hypothetical protein
MLVTTRGGSCSRHAIIDGHCRLHNLSTVGSAARVVVAAGATAASNAPGTSYTSPTQADVA